jgi:nitric oxide reductase large subunit
VFELLAIAASTYFVTGLSGTQDHWFYKTCISAKLNSGPIIVTIEVLAGLLAMELSLAALHRKRRRRGRDAAKSKGHKLAVSMKGMKPSASLLRSSGGLSLSESSSRSFYSQSLD